MLNTPLCYITFVPYVLLRMLARTFAGHKDNNSCIKIIILSTQHLLKNKLSDIFL